MPRGQMPQSSPPAGTRSIKKQKQTAQRRGVAERFVKMASIMQCRLFAIAATVLILVLPGAASAQKVASPATKKAALQQQACAAKCQAQVEENSREDAEDMDEPYTPEEMQQERRACMIDCLGGSGARLENVPRVTPQGSSACSNIVGTWNWPNGSVMAFYKNGTVGTAGQAPGGTWTCSGGTVTASFSNGGRDQYKVAPDGNNLSFTTSWLPGTYTATRKSR